MRLCLPAQAALTQRHRLSGWITQQTFLTALEAQVQLANALADKTSPWHQGCHPVIPTWPLSGAVQETIHTGERKSLSSSFYKETNLISLASHRATNPV